MDIPIETRGTTEEAMNEIKNLQPPELSWKIIEWRETKGLSE